MDGTDRSALPFRDRARLYVDDMSDHLLRTVRWGLGADVERPPVFPPSPLRVTCWYWARRRGESAEVVERA